MKKYILLFAAAVFLLVLAYGCEGDRDAAEAEAAHQQEAAPQVSQQGQTANQLAATSDQKTASGKWKANPETTQGIESMMEMVGGFTAEDANSRHCSKLKRVLFATFDRILQQCTMQGPAHDALHEYLLPLKDKIGLIAADDAEQCLQTVRELSEYLATYYEKFE